MARLSQAVQVIIFIRVRAPKALGVHRTREEQPDKVILIEDEDGVQRTRLRARGRTP